MYMYEYLDVNEIISITAICLLLIKHIISIFERLQALIFLFLFINY